MKKQPCVNTHTNFYFFFKLIYVSLQECLELLSIGIGTQSGCEDSFPGDIQEQSEHSPEQWCCLSREVGLDDPWLSLPISAILWLPLHYVSRQQGTKFRLEGVSFENSSPQSSNLLRNHKATWHFTLVEISGFFFVLAPCCVLEVSAADAHCMHI